MFSYKRSPTGDFSASATRITRSRTNRFSIRFCTAMLSAVLYSVSSTVVWAKEISWHQFSESYEVRLGVVPASVADQDKTLRQMHAILRHGSVKRTNGLRHIMVSIFRRPGAERVSNVIVSAEVIETDLIHMRRENKNLDIMMLPGGVSYCNFFTLHWNGMYEIKVRIMEPEKETEWVTFYQMETAMAD